jgi:hypothetical protein
MMLSPLPACGAGQSHMRIEKADEGESLAEQNGEKQASIQPFVLHMRFAWNEGEEPCSKLLQIEGDSECDNSSATRRETCGCLLYGQQ